MEYVITEVATQTNDWENNYGKYRSFMVRFEGVDNQVEISRKKQQDGSVKTPKLGDKLTGTITTKENGIQKFKQDYSSSSSYSPSSGNSKKDSPSQEFWNSKDKRISRQHSQEMALRLLIANKEPGQKITVAHVSKAADEFDNDLPELLDE